MRRVHPLWRGFWLGLILTAALVLLGMFIIAFVIFVMLSLSQNLLSFVVQIFNEITMR